MKIRSLLSLLLCIGLASCTMIKETSNSNDEKSSTEITSSEEITTIDSSTTSEEASILFDNTSLKIYIWATGTSNSAIYYTENEINNIKKYYEKLLKNPDKIEYYIFNNMNLSSFASKVLENDDADVILAGSNMDTSGNIPLMTDDIYGKKELEKSWYSSDKPRYIGVYSKCAKEKLETVKILIDLLTFPMPDDNTTKRILMLGNSYTFYNDMYKMYGDILKEKNYDVEVETFTRGGAFLTDYASDGQYYDEFESYLDSKIFDYVIIQEQSSKSIKNYNGFLAGAKGVAAIIRNHYPKAKLFLYETWARHESNSFYIENPSWTYYTASYALADNYKAVGRVIDAKVSFVGLGFYDIYKNHNEIELYQNDYTHPSPRGSYLAALMLAKTTFNVEPLEVSYIPNYVITLGGADKTQPTEEEAKLIKQIASITDY